MKLFNAIFDSACSDATAVLYEGRQLTYQELQRETESFANVLRALNIGSGERVAILLNDSPEFIASFISILGVGAIAVPVNMGLRLDAQKDILRDCTASMAIVETDFCNRLLTGALETLHHLRDLVVVERGPGDAGFIKEAQADAGDLPLRIQSLSDLRAQATNKPASLSQPRTADEPAFILYTSGSTGEPKGAVHRIADIFYTNETYCREVLKLRGGDRLFSSSRLPFAYGLGNAFTFPLLNGFTSILCREKPTPELIARIMRDSRPTIFFGVPTVYTSLLEHHKNIEPLICSSLRLCVSAGEALPASLGEEWEKTFGVPVLDGIGSTEMLHMWMSNQEDDRRYGSSGKLLKGYEARLMDAQGNASRLNEEGNLWVRGASAALGYWKRPEATARTFVDGWVRTGDLYRCDGDGYWYHVGRSDDCFKSSGQWVSPVEVEGVLLRHPGLSRVAVVEDFDEHGLSCACAFVIKQHLEADSVMTEVELREMCRSELPRHKRPRRYVFVDRLPYTATGKIQRFKLREQLRQKSPNR